MLSLAAADASAAGNLQVTYSSRGVQKLTYNGTVLQDVNQNPSQAFHIWHMKAENAAGILTGGDYGWGELCSKAWNSPTTTMTYSCSWGKIATAFTQSGNVLTISVAISNNTNSGITFDGASIYPLSFQFPANPVGLTRGSPLQDNMSGPGVSVADFGTGEVALVNNAATQPLYTGWQAAAGVNAYSAMVSSTSPDSLALFLPRYDRKVAPGTTAAYSIALRFGPEGSTPKVLAGDVYSNWATFHPATLKWTDHRIIGTAYLASSPAGGGGNTNAPGGYPTNPRRWWNDSSVNITTPSGLAAFQQRMIQQAHSNVANAQRMLAQGVITWDVEGEQFPQTTSYVCSPDQIATIAPEMESVIASGPYAGQKLDDAYFRIQTSAGLKVGGCIRPNQFILNSNRTASQNYISGNSQLAAILKRKMSYAQQRWGWTLFYVDSNVDVNGAVLDASIYKELSNSLPGALIMPEEANTAYYAYTAPFLSFIFHRSLGTDSAVRYVYPNAFSVNLVNDVSAGTLLQYTPQLVNSVKSGDILMGHADYWQSNNPMLIQIYQEAGQTP